MHNRKWNKISQFEDSEQSPGFLLWKTQLIWRRQIERVLSDYQLTQPQFVIMASIGYLTANDNTVSQIELATYTLMDINTTSQVLRALEKGGLIERKNKLGNDKTKYSTLTELGYETLKKAISAVEKFDCDFFNVLAETDLNNTKQILDTLIKENSK
jgi:DNA-binding MarR family transcriptional regulator